ncbi:MAG: VWA domain-containing protein [Pyrinomonadaceae bacterium]|nr:VWA domain-containing protein [Pyrinomonadaceae bacterium]
MKENYTDVNIVLDRSGSMASIKNDTIGGFNEFLREQQTVEGMATITLAQFDDVYDIVYRAIDVKAAPMLDDKTFVPRGSTALLDAIGRTINETGKRLSGLGDSEKPEKVIFVIVTDGEENSSREFDNGKINEMISHQRDVYKWEFVFLGANQDAIASASNMGIQASHAMTYAASPEGTQMAFQAVSKNMASARRKQKADYSFEDVDRDQQKI